jgi:ABC-type Fe3+-siderophore transport system permease subunit
VVFALNYSVIIFVKHLKNIIMKQTQTTGKKYFTTFLVVIAAVAFLFITISSFTIYRTGEDLFKQLGIAKIDADEKIQSSLLRWLSRPVWREEC